MTKWIEIEREVVITVDPNVDNMDWVKEGVDYWDNPDCPREYLEDSLVKLVDEVEGEALKKSDVEILTDEKLREDVGRYEYFSDK